MKNHRQRLKAIEVTLTPKQVVLLWMDGALKGNFERGAFQSPPARGAIANSIARIVENSLRGEADVVIERAILQARQEADWLYSIVVEVNSQVQSQSFACEREYLFLFAYLAAAMKCPLTTISEEPLRTLTLLFVEKMLVLEGAATQISAERFGGKPILFTDSAAKLKGQLKTVDEALELFNFLATEARFPLLSKENIHNSLSAAIDQKISRIMLLARGVMLGSFGQTEELKATFNRLAAAYSSG